MGQAVRNFLAWPLDAAEFHDFRGKTLQLGIFLTAGTRMWRIAHVDIPGMRLLT